MMAVVATVAVRPQPAELLADMLREDRARGFAFEDVWDEDVAFAVGQSSGWRDALEGTREAWQASWGNAPGPRSQGLTLDLADDTREQVPASPVPA
jgi:hypothetical protein